MWRLISGVFLGWSLGANDAANVFGTGVTTGIVRYRTAVLLTALFAMVGALLEGPKCMGIVGDLSRLLPRDTFPCTLAAAITMTLMTYIAIPASASQAIIGAVIGAGILSGSADFTKLYKIVACWVVTPIGALVVGYTIHRVLGYVLDKTVISLNQRNLFYSAGVIVTGCYSAYSLGANNVANVTGVYVGSGMLRPEMAALVGGLSIAGGVLTYSKKVMMTVGKGIVPLDPFSALVVLLAEGVVLHLFTQIGIPVSSSQAVVGAVVGVGLVGDIRTVSVRILAKIGVGWVFTPILAGSITLLLAGVFI